MTTYTNGQDVEVEAGGAWRTGTYIGELYGDHYVRLSYSNGEGHFAIARDNDSIRPVVNHHTDLKPGDRLYWIDPRDNSEHLACVILLRHTDADVVTAIDFSENPPYNHIIPKNKFRKAAYRLDPA